MEDQAEGLIIIPLLIQNRREVEILLLHLCLKEIMVLKEQFQTMLLPEVVVVRGPQRLLYLLDLQVQDHVWWAELAVLVQVDGPETQL